MSDAAGVRLWTLLPTSERHNLDTPRPQPNVSRKRQRMQAMITSQTSLVSSVRIEPATLNSTGERSANEVNEARNLNTANRNFCWYTDLPCCTAFLLIELRIKIITSGNRVGHCGSQPSIKLPSSTMVPEYATLAAKGLCSYAHFHLKNRGKTSPVIGGAISVAMNRPLLLIRQCSFPAGGLRRRGNGNFQVSPTRVSFHD